MKYLCISCILFITSLEMQGQVNIGLPMIKNFTPDMYIGGIQNWDIVQDNRGIIYVANNFGLLQFDGNTWRRYAVYGATKLRSIAIGNDGKIYAGLQGDFGYYSPDSTGTLHYLSLKSLIPEGYRNFDETWKTYVIQDKAYFCTFYHIYEYDGQRIKVLTLNEQLDVSYENNNTLYTQAPGKGVYSLNNGNEFIPLPYHKEFSDKIISGIISTEPNFLLISTSMDGVFMANNGSVVPWEIELNDVFKKSFINAMVLLKNGNIAIGTQHSGAFILNRQGELIYHLDKGKGLLNRTILSLYEDNNNNLWIGQNNGISFVKLKSPFRLLNEEVGIPGTGYAAYAKDNKVLLGTNNGAFIIEHNSVSDIRGSGGQVYSITEAGNHVLMGHNNGAYKIYDGPKGIRADPFYTSTGVWTFNEFQDKLLMGTYHGIHLLNKDNLSFTDSIKHLNESSRIIEVENDSTIWMAHGYKGIYKIEPDPFINNPSIVFYNKDNGLPGSFFNSIFEFAGKLVFITEDGLYQYNSRLEKFNKDSVMSNLFTGEQIITLKTDIFNNLYFITDKSVGFIENRNTLGYKKHSQAFQGIRNLLNDDLPNINIIGPNQVLFGAREGFILFDRNNLWTIEGENFLTLIRKVVILNGDKILYGGDSDKNIRHVDLPYPHNSVKFEFSSVSFTTSDPVKFQYMLKGFDKQWSHWTTTNFKEYTNLKEGSYSFLVRSQNSYGEVSDTAHYSFAITPPWYRTYQAYGAYSFLIVLLISGSLLFVNKKHSKEKKILERKRIDELKEKENQLHSITENKENQINKLKNEKLESEIRHIEKELATNTMHLLYKNEFINSIKGTLQTIERKSHNQEVKSQIQKVVHNIGKNIERDKDWENFQLHFDKVHGNFSTRIQNDFPNLTPQEIKLSTYLRLNLTTKEIANLLNITVRGVEIARYRLRKKLSIERHQNLTDFILHY